MLKYQNLKQAVTNERFEVKWWGC